MRACSARKTSSSVAPGGVVCARSAANRIGQPVAALTCSRVVPGCSDVTVSSRVTGSGSITHRSVTTTVGPAPGKPARTRASPPYRCPTVVMKSSVGTKLRVD
ncbi:hypothetical protein [Xanthomonas oryzae pv. oryzae MAFF 311018]|nr:hypothetical protein [Xanthomonas oryzae pv. oryzae MAFF 311018]